MVVTIAERVFDYVSKLSIYRLQVFIYCDISIFAVILSIWKPTHTLTAKNMLTNMCLQSLSLVSIKCKLYDHQMKNKASTCLSSHPSHQLLCFCSESVFVVVVIPGGEDDSLTFGTGVPMSSNFLRPPNNQSNLFKNPNNQLSS